jgi:hypothetical protein
MTSIGPRMTPLYMIDKDKKLKDNYNIKESELEEIVEESIQPVENNAETVYHQGGWPNIAFGD